MNVDFDSMVAVSNSHLYRLVASLGAVAVTKAAAAGGVADTDITNKARTDATSNDVIFISRDKNMADTESI